MSSHTRDELVYLAKLAEQCERYDGKSSHLLWSKMIQVTQKLACVRKSLVH